jgi:hypothetical protein
MMVIDTRYELGQTVYLTTDEDQSRRLITAITIRQSGILYELSCGTTTSSHYDFEMSDEVNIEIKTR